jgi:hypothetical protein
MTEHTGREAGSAPPTDIARLTRELEEAELYEQKLRERILAIRDQLAAGHVAQALSMCNQALNEIDHATDVVASAGEHSHVRQAGRPLVVSIVTFQLAKRWTVDEAAAVFTSTAPTYLGKPGLVRKHYYVTESGDRAGGIYFWDSKAAAEACYTPEWKAMVAGKYGSPPDILYVTVPVSVDNVEKRIVSP